MCPAYFGTKGGEVFAPASGGEGRLRSSEKKGAAAPSFRTGGFLGCGERCVSFNPDGGKGEGGDAYLR